MFNVRQQAKKVLSRAHSVALAPLVMLSTRSFAAIPDVSAPSVTVTDGDFISLLLYYAYDILIVIGLVLCTVGFIAVAKNMIGVYSEIGTGRKTWSDMGMNGGMGVLLLVFIVYLLTQAAGVIE